jgi:hypothetical protein
MSAHLSRPWLRSAVVASLTLAGGLAWFGAVTALWAAATGHGGRPPLLLLLSASVVFIAVLPALRRKTERLANWVAFGRRADGYELVTELVRRMTNGLSVDDVMPRLAEAAARSAHSTRGEVRLQLGDGDEQRQVWPPTAATASSPVTVPVRHGGATIGLLGVDSSRYDLLYAERRQLGELAGPAGLALTAVRLTVELRRRLAEVQALNVALRSSQRRLVAARRTERDRIRSQAERLVTPHLDALAAHLAESVSARPAADLDAARHEAVAALDALRLLSRSIFSPVLADSGLEPALRAWADQVGRRLQVSAHGDLSLLHRHRSVETALHFACVTVLDEVDAAPTVDIEVTPVGASVVLPWPVERRPPQSEDPVLERLRDRVDALGGRLRIDAVTSTLHAWLPLDAVTSDAARPA